MGIRDSANGKFVIVVGPSGVGKNTMMNLLMEKYPDVLFSVSATAREMREGEVDGETYHFMSNEEFEKNISDGNFFEWAKYAGNYYGTLKQPIFDAINSGRIILADIECQGFMDVKKILNEKNFVSIFLMPPSIEVLVERIKARAKISDEELEKRVETIKFEMGFVDEATVVFEPIDGDIEGSFKGFDEVFRKYVLEK